MTYEQASAVLSITPAPRVELILQTGEVLRTPAPMLAACSRGQIVLSVDGSTVRRFTWDQIRALAPIPAHTQAATS